MVDRRRPRTPACDQHLFFGCRHRDQDFLFQDELARLQRQGALTKLYTAFSRETASKLYVTHRLRQNAATVVRLIREGVAVIYVCGDGTHMAKDVEAAILDILASTHSNDSGDSSEEDSQSQTPHMSHRQRAVAELELLKRRKRYLQDIWS
jgi:sulfite reductase alpha subunit-like flavoprotein